MNLRIFLNQLRLGLKLYLRLPAAIFWLFAFPLVMLIGLGTVTGSSGQAGLVLVWAHAAPAGPVDQLLLQSLTERGIATQSIAPEEAEPRWREGKLPLLLEGSDGAYHLRLNSYLLAQGSHIEALLQQAFLLAQSRAANLPEPARIPVMISSPGGRRDGPYVAFLLPGLMGLNLVMMGIFSNGMVDVNLRQKGGYKRLATTPLPRAIYLAAQFCVRLIALLISASLLMFVGAALFGIYNQGSYAAIYLLVVLGACCFIALGYVLASFARNTETYTGIANLAFLPLMLLSGVYFSLDQAPKWLQMGADLLPLALLLKSLRAVFNDGASLVSQGPSLAILMGWTVLLFFAATKRFRWV